jgi:hypothetical protein
MENKNGRKKSENIRVPLDVPKEQFENLKEFTSKRAATVNGTIRIAIDKFLKDENEKDNKK